MKVYTHYYPLTDAGDTAKKVYGKVAKQFFDKALELGANYLDADFLSNAFIHPLYLMRYRRNSPQCVSLRNRFTQDRADSISSPAR